MPFQNKWTLDDKLNACNYYTVYGGNSKTTAKKTGIPAQTLRGWTKQDWWHEMVQDIRKRHADRLDGKFTYVIDKLYRVILDRIEEGDDVIWSKTGEVVKRGISAKDSGVLLNMILEKRALLRGDPTSRSSTVTIDKQMDSIQKKLEQRTKDMRKQVAESANVTPLENNA